MTAVIAGLLFFEVAERLALTSARARLAVRIAALGFLGQAIVGMPVVAEHLGPAWPWLGAAGWGGLAAAALALLADAKEEVRR